jgi:8-hydroxy-5-deazaflavin:NADPH oxidoreductase
MMSMMKFLLVVWLSLATLIVPRTGAAETIAVIGTGEVGGALGPELASLGHTIVYGSRESERDDVVELVSRTGKDASATTPERAASEAGIVILAVPGLMVEQITRSLGDLSGKIIIDPTNALRRAEDGSLEMAVESSNAELIQNAAPGAYVVKAFNTLNWRQMVDPESSGGPISIPLVGDNADAKARVAALATALGLEPIDLGPLKYARYVEGMLILWINSEEHFEYHLRR